MEEDGLRRVEESWASLPGPPVEYGGQEKVVSASLPEEFGVSGRRAAVLLLLTLLLLLSEHEMTSPEQEGMLESLLLFSEEPVDMRLVLCRRPLDTLA